ncbi:MAG: c-type cytochrome [Geminicoccaceae bacterium]
MRILAILGSAAFLTFPAHAEDAATRGAYLARIMDCGGCHTPGAFTGKPNADMELAGADVGFAVPGLGVFYPPNLTPDPETGLGEWSEAEIVAAIRTGARPDGRELVVMPWRSYAALSDEDANALAAYLKSMAPVANAVPQPSGADEKAPGPYLAVMMP